jgi:hypothetical protein
VERLERPHQTVRRALYRRRVPLQRLRRIDLPGDRPRWLTVGTLRLLALCGVIVGIGMLPGHLTRAEAGIIGWTGLAVLGLAVTVPFAAATRRLASRLPVADAVLVVLRHAGLVGLGLAFFLFWTFVYLLLWWRHPVEAFTGLGPRPRFNDFFYTAVSTAFVSPPGDILANSRGARSATMIEMLTGFGLLAAYLSSFLDFGRGRAAEADADAVEPADAPGPAGGPKISSEPGGPG